MPTATPPPSSPASGKVTGMLGTAITLGLLYLGKDVLIPITLAILLSIFISPMIRKLRHWGIGHTSSVWIAVLVLTMALSAVGGIIGTQVFRIGAELPKYEETIRDKFKLIHEVASSSMRSITGRAGQVMTQFSASNKAADTKANDEDTPLKAGKAPIPVEIHNPPPSPLTVLSSIFSTVWSPLETTGIVFVVLIFVLLEHEALRDRLIRLIGSHDLRATTIAVNDAGERLSRFFVSQFLVNLIVAIGIWLGLLVLGVEHAILWGAMAGVLRFVPYIGVWIAAVCASLLAAAMDPGWGLALNTFALFFAVEMVIAQWVEPQLYAHSTGLSPLSVVVAAIFWSWLWGPVGLVVSTPLTLCLVVAGRYIPALNVLEILLGEVRALSLAQNFYQRALSGDANEIIVSARLFLKRKSFAEYCDTVLLPALHLARHDLDEGNIAPEEKVKLGQLVFTVIEALDTQSKKRKKSKSVSLLEDVSLGRQLRAQRELQDGRWQGSIEVPAGSIVMCLGLGAMSSEIAAEILVRVLRNNQVDARHFSIEDMAAPPPPGARLEAIAMLCVVCTEPVKEIENASQSIALLRERFACSRTLMVMLNNPYENRQGRVVLPDGEQSTDSYQSALAICLKTLEKCRTNLNPPAKT
jgi:predicted PurR-regulated permease PerM